MVNRFIYSPLPDYDADGSFTYDVSIGSGFSDLQAFILRAGMARWEHWTNIDFREGDASAETHLDIKAIAPASGHGGYSYGAELIFIHPTWYDDVEYSASRQAFFQSLGMHEMGHSIALAHIFDGTVSVMDYRFTDEDPSAYDVESTDILYQAAPVTTVIGSDGDDLLVGTDGADVLSALAGADTLLGGGDADRLYGGDGGDVLYGNQDQDMLIAGAGDDILYGGKDSDTLSGGAGTDLLVGGQGADLFVASDGGDIVADFDAAEGDRIGGFAGLVPSASDTAVGAAVVLYSGQTITLVGVEASEVEYGWFVNWLL